MTGTFEGVGTLQFTPDNKYGYIYSGTVSVPTTTDTTLLSFKTESEYIVAQVDYGMHDHAMTVNTQWEHWITFNDQIVMLRSEEWFTDEGRKNSATLVIPFRLIIPPFTEVKFIANHTDGNSINAYGVITGKVKGAIEQENLEAITDNNKWASK